MIASETWRIYRANLSWLFLAGLLAEVIQAMLTLLFGGFAKQGWPGFGLGLGKFSLDGINAAQLPQVGSALLGMGLLYVLLSVLVGAFTTSGLIQTVVQAQQGKLNGLGAFWSGGVRYWARLLGYGLLILLPALGLGLVSLLAFVLPWLVVPLLIVAFGSLGVAYWYGAYALVAEDLYPGDAFTKLFRILGNRFGDVIWSLVLLIAAGLVLGLVSGVLSVIPLIGPLLTWLLNAAITPLFLLYAGVRYVTNIAPVINPPGGSGSFHGSPPPGP